jgi:1-aminocyclopropane-1-carboxylate deaminase
MQHLFQPPRLVPVNRETYAQKGISVAVLRLDEIHPVISGNKWFKLKAYLADAVQQGKKTVLTFGGAYSNHIVATAAACATHRLQSIGIIRGEAPNVLSPTLLDARQYGMHLFFISREAYKTKSIPAAVHEHFKKSELYIVDEGGSGELGVRGSMDILKSYDTQAFTNIIAAVGTGTMLAGLIRGAAPHQHVTGISVLKNNLPVHNAISKLAGKPKTSFQVLHNFHFGGYAKHTLELLRFMNDWYSETNIPTDFVYTAKTFFAAEELIQTGFFPPGSSLLIIHSGGLQGNRSLPAGTLRF